ncbi:MAG: hypothetical protein I8H94_03030 [Rhodobacteraceae bacterium]|nr:hypothetical protein [Paracoccaceae bacterium]
MLNRVFGYFAKKRVAADVEKTLQITFSRLLFADKADTQLKRRFDASAAIASCLGALRDRYPGKIVEPESIGLAFLDANAGKKYDDADALLEAILNLVRDCPKRINDQAGVVIYIIAPVMAQRMRKLGLV